MPSTSFFDVIVVGGGIAGSALAGVLAQPGLGVLVTGVQSDRHVFADASSAHVGFFWFAQSVDRSFAALETGALRRRHRSPGDRASRSASL